jgi:4-diphosphocytidyl-2-C-methyl-D-erythritol kinase
VNRAPATAKLNLALVVGRAGENGMHEVTTVYQRLDLADRVAVVPVSGLRVSGFAEDTLVRKALEALAEAAGVAPAWEARLTKRIPVAAGLGGGSSDAATALRLANELLAEPLPEVAYRGLGRVVGVTAADQLDQRHDRDRTEEVHADEPLAPGHAAYCTRCGSRMARHAPYGFNCGASHSVGTWPRPRWRSMKLRRVSPG